MNLVIRQAEKKDLKYVHQLVVELAIYEKEPDAVTATLKDYEVDFDEGIFQVLVADLDGDIIGIALYYMTYSTWKGKMIYLEDLVVNEKYRRQGVGQQLLEALFVEAKNKKAVLIKWQVLDWNEPAIEFYSRYNVTFENEWINCKYFIINPKKEGNFQFLAENLP